MLILFLSFPIEKTEPEAPSDGKLNYQKGLTILDPTSEHLDFCRTCQLMSMSSRTTKHVQFSVQQIQETQHNFRSSIKYNSQPVIILNVIERKLHVPM